MQLAHDDGSGDKASGRYEISIIRSAFEHGRQAVEGGGKCVGNGWQVDEEKVAAGGLAAVTAGLTELRVEFGEELGVDSDWPALGQRFASAPSVAAIRVSALRRARARRSGGTAAGSVTKPARTAASRSSGDSASSSAAVRTRSTLTDSWYFGAVERVGQHRGSGRPARGRNPCHSPGPAGMMSPLHKRRRQSSWRRSRCCPSQLGWRGWNYVVLHHPAGGRQHRVDTGTRPLLGMQPPVVLERHAGQQANGHRRVSRLQRLTPAQSPIQLPPVSGWNVPPVRQ